MKKKTSVIAFRCPPEVTRAIDDQCQPLRLSRGDWVRAAVLSKVQEATSQSLAETLERIEARLAEVEGRLKQVSRSVSKATYLLLIHDRLSKEEAKTLVQRHLVHEEDHA